MKNVVSISLGAGSQDFEFDARFLGERFRVRRIGTDGNISRTRKLLQEWGDKADALGLGVQADAEPVGRQRSLAAQAARLAASVRGKAPVTTGTRLGEIFLEWAVRGTQVKLGSYFNNARVLFFSGLTQQKLAQAMAEYTDNLHFADPVVQLGVPKLLTSLEALSLYARGAHYVGDWSMPRSLARNAIRDWSTYVLRKAMQHATVIVAPVYELDRFGLEELAGKTVITSTVNEARVQQLRDKGVQLIIDAAPMMFGHVLAPNMLDAMIVAATGKEPDDLLEDDYLSIISDLQLEPRLIYPGGERRVNRFAFVIHPLSQEYFKKFKPLEIVTSKVKSPVLMDTVEKLMAWAPPFVYSRVTGIRSPTGVEAEGWLITVGGTPRQIMSHSPQMTYRRLLDAAKMAKRLGAQIMGLGAFTKVVGDAGVTVAKLAPLPITTGNSYSASGALWAAHEAVRRLGMIAPPQDKGRLQLRAMVVGATGAIGSVCARLLAKVAHEIYLVSPEAAKLLALKESILKESPGAQVFVAARADRHLGDMDVIVTATSGAGKKVLDIMKVKPGCVITDVARPLDLPPEEVAKRPDVLVIESGEILLPGEVQMKNIGLPKNVAYACLAETIVLALEGRFENFTVGRAIEWEKVREIYRLGLKHGMKLAAISGVNGVFTDEDIARVRNLARAARAKAAQRLAQPKAERVAKKADAVEPPADGARPKAAKTRTAKTPRKTSKKTPKNEPAAKAAPRKRRAAGSAADTAATE